MLNSLNFAIFFRYIFLKVDYLKKSLKNLEQNRDYEEIDTRLASGWYVDTLGGKKKKKYKTKEVSFKIAKKISS